MKITLHTTEKNQKEFQQKGMSGKRCIFELDDESGEIKLIGFNEHAKRLESSFKESVQVRFKVTYRSYKVIKIFILINYYAACFT